MHHQTSLTVEDILRRSHFENTSIIAGTDGLSRHVKWVHVVEVTNIKKLLNGNELILSTGVVWKENESLFLAFLQQLIDSNAAGLCIEIGTYTSSIPKEAVILANENHFPIILFEEEVQFVNITQDIHAALINKHYQIIQDLETYSQKLNQQLLTIDNEVEMIKLLHEYSGLQVIMDFQNKETICVPDIQWQNKVFNLEKLSSHQNERLLAKQPILLMEKQCGELVLISKDREINEFDLLILDRTVTALAQYFLRELYIEEKRRAEENEWIHRWLDGNHSDQETGEYLSFYEKNHTFFGGLVILCETNQKSSKADITYLNLYVRSIFEQQGFHLITTVKQGYIVYILLNKRQQEDWKNRIQEGLNRIGNGDFIKKQTCKIQKLAIGKYMSHVNDINHSYKAATETLMVTTKHVNRSLYHYYDDLHMHRVFQLFKSKNELKEMMNEYLEPVIDYDRKYNGKLMETLKTYLSCSGSKKETAKKLFVVRQTLYHRIEKLEKLLGEDFMDHSEKRLTIELMLFAYEFLYASRPLQSAQSK